MAAAIFISYSRGDMQETDWLGRLRMYLAPFGRRGTVDVWDDSRIAPGTRWRDEIVRALGDTDVAVLLVGPGFLASDFVMEDELPSLLQAAKKRGVMLFPLVVGFCGYKFSDLKMYQAFNSPDKPLESLPRPEQNQILNALAIAISKSLQATEPEGNKKRREIDLYGTVLAIQKDLKDTKTAFRAQCLRRNDLVAAIERRLQFGNDLEYEKFFYRHYSQLTDDERFEFDQIRAITEGPLQLGNRRILEAIDATDAVLEIAPEMSTLRQHLVFWLNKFDRVFSVNRAMCLLYTGVEDGVPFPDGLDNAVDTWLREHKP